MCQECFLSHHKDHGFRYYCRPVTQICGECALNNKYPRVDESVIQKHIEDFKAVIPWLALLLYSSFSDSYMDSVLPFSDKLAQNYFVTQILAVMMTLPKDFNTDDVINGLKHEISTYAQNSMLARALHAPPCRGMLCLLNKFILQSKQFRDVAFKQFIIPNLDKIIVREPYSKVNTFYDDII